MKILMLITTGFASFGGLTTVAMNYYKCLDKSEFRIDFASTNLPKGDADYEFLLKNNSKYFSLGNRKKKLFMYVNNLYKVLKNNKYDAIHVHGNSSTMAIDLFVAKLCGVSVRISHVHNTRSNYPMLNKLLSSVFNTLYTDAIATSIDAGKWIYINHYNVLNNAINLEKFSFSRDDRNQIRNNFNISSSFVIGNVGKLNHQKNQIFLIQIFAEITKTKSNAMLIIVGGGELESVLKAKCCELGIEESVIFTGMVPNASDYFQAFDVFVFTSIFEGLGLALIEAQASGLRCFSSDAVPKETQVTSNIQYLSLKSSAKEWADYILQNCDYNRDESAIRVKPEIDNAGYNIKYQAEKLANLYRGRTINDK